MSRYLHPGEEAGELRLCGDADRQAIMHWLASRLGLDGIKLGDPVECFLGDWWGLSLPMRRISYAGNAPSRPPP